MSRVVRRHFEVKETAVAICSEERYIRIAEEAIFEARRAVELKIVQDPFFGITYDPYPPSKDEHPLVAGMCRASVSAGVGPMAAVAGAISEYAVSAMASNGAEYAVVDNGGDIAFLNDRPLRVGLFAGSGSPHVCAVVEPSDRIRGICSSSGEIGPSVSFGRSRICTVMCGDAALADACATLFGNLVTGEDAVGPASERVCGIPGVVWCLTFCGDAVASCGRLPPIVPCMADESLITGITAADIPGVRRQYS
ncbi:MAG: UPF0280 family protein [Candidatus Methanoplasma sp.]|jgi:ApbE superfamily uncharacterized protein (UPF0280 family)|nr:UPF0280 family protein [Candidatus Methanoplasma sp.]